MVQRASKKINQYLKTVVVKELNNIRVAAGIHVFNNVIVGTPVDSGRARANWQASFGTPIKEEVKGTLKTKKIKKGRGKNAVVETKTEWVANTVPKDPASVLRGTAVENHIYLSNNLPYIYRLEYDGWSQQQPAGWVRGVIAKYPAIVEELIRKNSKLGNGGQPK